MPVVVAPFFRASVTIGPAERRLGERRLAPVDFEAGLRAGPEIFRQNLRRLFSAAWLAEALGAPLVCAEGWRSNAVAGRRRTRFVSGSWFFAAWLRVLRRRGLVAGTTVIRRDVSRCTWEEARAVVAIAEAHADRRRVIGVSDAPCPSALRVARYLRPIDSVLTPAAAVARAGRVLRAEPAGFWAAVQPRSGERWRSPIVEAPNWIVHAASELGRLVVTDPPLEARLARALRADRPRTPPA